MFSSEKRTLKQTQLSRTTKDINQECQAGQLTTENREDMNLQTDHKFFPTEDLENGGLYATERGNLVSKHAQ